MPRLLCFADLLGFRTQTNLKGSGVLLYGYALGMLCVYTENLSLFKLLVARPTVMRCSAAH